MPHSGLTPSRRPRTLASMMRSISAIGLLSLALGLGACTQMSETWTSWTSPTDESQPEKRPTEASLRSAFPDISLPKGSEIDLDRSFVFSSPTQTVGKLAADVPYDVATTFRFYQNQMPADGWSLVNAFQSGTASLYYAKSGRFAGLIIERTGRHSCRVTFNVGPE